MATIKLHYLNLKGRAELIRFILAQADVDYEDDRIETERWAETMPGIEFGTAVLEYEGKTLQKNATIAKFLAEKYGLAGTNAEEVKDTEEILELSEITWDRMAKIFWEKDNEKKMAKMTELGEKGLPAILKKLDDKASKNNSEKAWIVGQNVTYADFAITILLDALKAYKPEILSFFPKLLQLKTSVEELPNIQKWITKRPTTAH